LQYFKTTWLQRLVFAFNRGIKLMYYNFKAKALGNFSSVQYWSSSETDFNNAWIMDFGLGVSTENNTAKSYAARAVRYF